MQVDSYLNRGLLAVGLPEVSQTSVDLINTVAVTSAVFAAAMLAGASVTTGLTCAAISAVVYYVATHLDELIQQQAPELIVRRARTADPAPTAKVDDESEAVWDDENNDVEVEGPKLAISKKSPVKEPIQRKNDDAVELDLTPPCTTMTSQPGNSVAPEVIDFMTQTLNPAQMAILMNSIRNQR